MTTSPPSDRTHFSGIAGRWGVIVTGLALLGGLPACTTVPDAATRNVEADRLELSPLISRDPVAVSFSEALAHFSMALSHELRKDTPAAMEAYRRAIEKAPENDNLYLLTSQRLIQNGREEDAYKLLDTLLERDPDNARLLRWRAHLHLKQQETEEALALLRRAVALHPKQEQVYLLTLRLEMQEERLEEGLEIGRLGLQHAESPEQLTRWMVELLLAQSKQSEDLRTSVALQEEAEALLAKAIESFPNETRYPLRKAQLFMEGGSPEKAWPFYLLADKRSDNPAEFRAGLLMHMIRSAGGAQEGLVTARDFLETDPESDYLKAYLLGQLQEVARTPTLALEQYKKAMELAPDDWAIQRKLALLYYSNDQPFRASQQLERVLESQPDDPEIRMLAAQLYLAGGQFEKAVRHFEKLDVLQRQGETIEDPVTVQTQFAMVLMALGREEEAVDAMYTATKANPANLERIWAHQMRLSLDDRDAGDMEAFEQRQRLMLEALFDLSDLLPDNPLVEIQIGITYNFRREHSRAVQAFERANELAEDTGTPSQWMTPDVRFEWGNSLERSGKYDEAVRMFEDVILVDPQHHRAMNYVAYMWAEKAVNLDKALRYVERALQLDPGNGSYLDTLGWVYYHQGQFDAALEELQKAADAEPMEPVIVEHMGDVMLKLNRPVEAAGYYRITLQLGAGEREDTVLASLKTAEDLVRALVSNPIP